MENLSSLFAAGAYHEQNFLLGFSDLLAGAR